MRPHGKFAAVDPNNPTAFAQCDQRLKGVVLIYEAVNVVTNCRYIGLTTRTLERRRQGHMRGAAEGSRTKFHRAIRKYGAKNFHFETIAIYSSVPDALKGERGLITGLKPYYNLAVGGEGPFGVVRSKRTRALLRQIGLKPENQQRWKTYQALGPQAMKKAVVLLKTGEVFRSVGDAAKILRISKREAQRLHRAGSLRFLTKEECRLEGLPYSESHSWSSERRRKFEQLKQKQCLPVRCVDDGRVFTSITEAGAHYGVCFSKRQANNAHISIRKGWRIRGRLFAYLENS